MPRGTPKSRSTAAKNTPPTSKPRYASLLRHRYAPHGVFLCDAELASPCLCLPRVRAAHVRCLLGVQEDQKGQGQAAQAARTPSSSQVRGRGMGAWHAALPVKRRLWTCQVRSRIRIRIFSSLPLPLYERDMHHIACMHVLCAGSMCSLVVTREARLTCSPSRGARTAPAASRSSLRCGVHSCVPSCHVHAVGRSIATSSPATSSTGSLVSRRYARAHAPRLCVLRRLPLSAPPPPLRPLKS